MENRERGGRGHFLGGLVSNSSCYFFGDSEDVQSRTQMHRHAQNPAQIKVKVYFIIPELGNLCGQSAAHLRHIGIQLGAPYTQQQHLRNTVSQLPD